MTISEKQRQQRRDFIGGSDVGAIFGFDDFKNAHDVWVQKVYETLPDKTSAPADIGNCLEESLVVYAKREFKIDRIIRNQRRVKGVFAANLDARVADTDKNWVIEAKTTSNSGEWGRPKTDQVPYKVNLQVQHQMYCADAERAIIPVVFGNPRLRMCWFSVDRDDDVIGVMVERCNEFMRLVRTKTPPSGPPPAIKIMSKIVREPESIVDLAPEVAEKIRSWEAAKVSKNLAEKVEQSLRTELINSLLGAEAGILNGGALTYLPDTRGARRLRWRPEHDAEER
jgi:putative phage-type endonuclease